MVAKTPDISGQKRSPLWKRLASFAVCMAASRHDGALNFFTMLTE
jgi:hypothetical protein